MLPALGVAGIGAALAIRVLGRRTTSGTMPSSTGTTSGAPRPYAERHPVVPYSEITQAASQQSAANLPELGAGTSAWIVGRFPILGAALREAILQKAKRDAAAKAAADTRAGRAAAAAELAASQRAAGETGTAAQAATSRAVQRSIPASSSSGATSDVAGSHPGVASRPAITTRDLALLE